MEILEERNIPRGKVTYIVRVFIDEGYTPNEFTSRDEEPALFAAWDSGEVGFVVVTVTPEIDGVEVTDAADSLGAVEYGTCDAWEPRTIGMDHFCAEYPVPDMIDTVRSNLAALGTRIANAN